jgi:hypothetical protein
VSSWFPQMCKCHTFTIDTTLALCEHETGEVENIYHNY